MEKSWKVVFVFQAWKSHGICEEVTKVMEKSWIFQKLILIIKMHEMHTCQLVRFCRI